MDCIESNFVPALPEGLNVQSLLDEDCFSAYKKVYAYLTPPPSLCALAIKKATCGLSGAYYEAENNANVDVDGYRSSEDERGRDGSEHPAPAATRAGDRDGAHSEVDNASSQVEMSMHPAHAGTEVVADE